MSPSFHSLRVSDPRHERDRLRFITFKSRALRGRLDLSLFVPEGAETLRDLPLVILLHGVYGSHWHWSFRGGAHVTAQTMIREGRVRPLVLAMPSDGLAGDGTGYVGRYETAILDELPVAAAEVAPCVGERSPLFLCGLSMGGFGALRLGAKHASRVRGVSAHSSITELAQLKDFIEEPLSSFDLADPAEGSILSWLDRHRGALPPIRFDCGRSDSLLEANRTLHRELDSRKIPHRYEEFDGEHNFAYWERRLPDTLSFIEGLL